MPQRFRIVGEPHGNEGSRSSSQWSIWSLIVLTFAAAVVLAGFVRMGLEGAIGTLLITCIGLYGGQQVLTVKSTVPRIIGGILVVFSIGSWCFVNSNQPGPLSEYLKELAGVFTSWTTWINLSVLFAIVLLFRRLATPRWDIEMVFNDNQLVSHRGLPLAKKNEFEKVCQSDPMFGQRICVRANRQSNGFLRTKIVGDISDGDRQKLRNILNTMI